MYLCEHGAYDCSVDSTINITMPCHWLAYTMGLQIRGRHGEFFDQSGSLIAFDPSARDSGPGALLFAKDPLLRHLRDHEMELFWIVVGEKNFYPPNLLSNRDEWLGRLVFSGAFHFIEDQLQGTLRANRRRRNE